MKKKILAAVLILLGNICCLNTFADVRLPSIIGSHMVLQQKTETKIWGWCDPGEKITITNSWDTTSITTTGQSTAKWNVSIKTPVAGGPFTITIKGNNQI